MLLSLLSIIGIVALSTCSVVSTTNNIDQVENAYIEVKNWNGVSVEDYAMDSGGYVLPFLCEQNGYTQASCYSISSNIDYSSNNFFVKISFGFQRDFDEESLLDYSFYNTPLFANYNQCADFPILRFSSSNSISANLQYESTTNRGYYFSNGFSTYDVNNSSPLDIQFFSKFHNSSNNKNVLYTSWLQNLFNLSFKTNYLMAYSCSISYFDYDYEMLFNKEIVKNALTTPVHTSQLGPSLTTIPFQQVEWRGTDFDIDLSSIEEYSNGNIVGLDLSNAQFFTFSISFTKAGNLLDYTTGYNNGKEDGYNTGYGEGYSAGFNDGSSNPSHLLNLFSGIADTPVLMIRSLFSFQLFGIPMYTAVFSLITLLILIFILRKFI